MPKPQTDKLTRRGQELYWRHRAATGIELTRDEFLDGYVCDGPSVWPATCQRCGCWRKLVGGFYCMACLGGAIAP